MDWKQIVEKTIENAKDKVAQLNLTQETVKYSSRIKSWRDISDVTGDEEVCRAFLVNRLVNALEYKPEFIELEKEYEAGRPKKIKPRIDVIVRDAKGNAFFFIEAKAPDKFESDKELIDDQLFKLSKLETAKNVDVKFLVYYTVEQTENGIRDKAIVIDRSQFKEYDEWMEAGAPSIADELPAQYNQPKKTPLVKGSKRDLKKVLNPRELKALATDLHNVLWGGGGTGDTEVFSSLVNIILAKIQDEYDRNDGEEYKFQIVQYGNHLEPASKVFERINDLYRKALTDQLNVVDNLDQQFVINQQKFPLNKLVYTVQKLEEVSFVDGKSTLDGKDILGDFFEQIQRDGFKQTKGQFFTPINIVRFILYALELDELGLRRLNNDKELPYITDPACGSGTFLIEAMKMITQEVKYRRRNEVQTNRLVKAKFEELFMPDNHEHRWAREYIYAIEHNFDLGTATKVNMILHGDGSTNTFVKDGLLPFRFYEKGTAPNHLKISQPDDSYDHKEINGQFDVLISNPPFSVNLDNETKRHLKNAFLFHNKRNSENLFLERYYQLLREGGRFGVVLPESVFDTTENKYMRLFLYKYFWIRAVVSIPQLAFQPYTSTKTSLLFAQKKTKGEVKKWNELWSKYSNEYQKLKTRAENYIKVYLKEEEKKKFPSIKDDTDKTIRDNVSRFLKRSLSKEDSSVSINDLLHKHNDELATLCNIDSDTKDIFGFVNTSWVFGEIAKEISYPIFIAEAENIGYKRSKRGEKTQPNELFDLEIAPSKIDVQKVAKQYEQELTDYSAKKASLEDELKKNEKNDKKKVQILARIKNLERQIAEVQQQSARVSAALKKYYDMAGNLLDKYVTRLDAELLGVFQLQRMEAYRSNYVLVRHSDHRTILDFLRKAQAWQ